MSIYQGTFPESLKTARVIPIFKGENEQLVHNYRPISVLPFYSKNLLNFWKIIMFFTNTNLDSERITPLVMPL